jgi:hypothetical protein
MKECPILKAGAMLTWVSTRGGGSVQGDSQFSACISTKDCQCIKDKCEWYQHGCPAHPM